MIAFNLHCSCVKCSYMAVGYVLHHVVKGTLFLRNEPAPHKLASYIVVLDTESYSREMHI
jgi:hypothetical protein